MYLEFRTQLSIVSCCCSTQNYMDRLWGKTPRAGGNILNGEEE